MEGKVRDIFPGANTANGSVNFFDNIISAAASQQRPKPTSTKSW